MAECPLLIGQTVAHFRILEKIGSGGMGEVYLAEDTTLDRKVALKILPPALAADAERRARFTREAKAVGALNHPNIVTVHSVQDAGGIHFITMELVKGETLAEILPKQGFDVGRFFEIAIPLADALAAAHQQGITHRDLKPANVMVGDDGRVKVLDFGLAKAQLEFAGGDGLTQTATQEGRIVGTLACLSPEQAEGKTVDARSDIFSLGIVFYEMLTGERPFGGGTAASIVSAILKDKPRSVIELQPVIPRQLARLVDRCLAKSPIDRFQSAIDLRHALEETKQDVDSGDLLTNQRSTHASRRSIKVPAAIFAVGLAAVIVSMLLSRNRESQDLITVLRLRNALQATSALAVESYPTRSPDGGRLAYQAGEAGYYMIGDHDIWVTQLGSGEPVKVTKHPANDRMPSWSPDGREIAFFSDRDGTWGLYTVAAIGGNPRKVLSLPGIGNLNWSAPHL